MYKVRYRLDRYLYENMIFCKLLIFKEIRVPRPGIEPGTQGFSEFVSKNYSSVTHCYLTV